MEAIGRCNKKLRILGRSIGVPIFQQYVRRDFRKLESPEETKATPTTTPIATLEDESKKNETNLLVSTLIATVTFAAALTMPGGFDNSNGMAILHARILFTVFVLSDTISFFLSISVVFNHFMTSTVSHKILARPPGKVRPMIRYSISSLVVAFGSGVFVVLPKYSPLGILVILLCSVLCYVIIIKKISYAALPTKRQIRTRTWLRSRTI